MRWLERLERLTKLQHMIHVPPLSARFVIYCIASYLVPIIALLTLPRGPSQYDDLVWLITLAPAFLLALHYGLRGALVGLLVGTIVFLGVEVARVFALRIGDWRISVPIYTSYGALSISVGWLSQELHDRYQRALETERLAGIGQLAVTIRHELNNALTTIVAESHMLAELERGMTEEQRASARAIHEAAQRIAADVRKLTNLESAPLAEYPGGVRMIDLSRAQERESPY